MKIAMIGQRGVPATFGGVERHVEELGARLAADGHEVVVFCRRGYGESEPERYRGHAAGAPAHRRLEAPRVVRGQRHGHRGDHREGLRRRALPRRRARAVLPDRARAVRRPRRANDSRARRRAGQVGSRRQRAAALRDLAQRPRAGPHDRRVEVAPGRLPRPVRPRDRAHRQRHPGGHPASGGGDHRAVGPDPWQLRAVRRPPGAREGARAPAVRVRRRPRATRGSSWPAARATPTST